jgi:hypothetical protein
MIYGNRLPNAGVIRTKLGLFERSEKSLPGFFISVGVHSIIHHFVMVARKCS